MCVISSKVAFVVLAYCDQNVLQPHVGLILCLMSIMSKSYIITIHAVFYVMQTLKSASNIAWIWRITSSAKVLGHIFH